MCLEILKPRPQNVAQGVLEGYSEHNDCSSVVPIKVNPLGDLASCDG